MDFILERLAVEAFSSRSRPRRISGLDDEAGHDSMDNDTVIVAYRI